MKPWKWICFGTLSCSLFYGAVIYPYAVPITDNSLAKVFYVVEPIFMVQLVCAVWMLYQAIRHESKPLRYALLGFFVPFAWLWYYFERFRPRRQPLSRASTLRDRGTGR